MEKLLLTDNDIVNNTPLGGNIDVDRYRVCIQDAQLSRIEEILGELLYVKMRDDYDDTDQDFGFAGLYLTLYKEYLRPAIIHQASVEYLLCAAYQITNGGISKHTPVNGTPVEKNEVDFLVQNQRAKADMYIQRMERFLRKNNIPEFTTDQNDIIPPNRSTSTSGWYFKRTNKYERGSNNENVWELDYPCDL